VSGNRYPLRKIRKILSFAFLLILLSVFAVIIASLILGYGFPPSWILNIFSRRVSPITVNEFSFDIGRANTFANLDGSVAAAGTLGIKVLDAGGIETLREPLRFIEPAISSYGNRCIAYDLGGTSIRVFEKTQVISTLETSSTIISASLNHNGWFCVVTQGTGNFKGTVAVYNNAGDNVYRVNLATGYALSTQLSYDNKTLAILTLAETGSRILYYNLDSEDDPAFIYELIDGLIIDIVYLRNGNVLALSTDSLFIVDNAGSGTDLYTFIDKRLGSYTINNDFIALHLYDHGLGHRGRLITLLIDGTVLGELSLDREIISMSAFNSSLIILRNDGVAFFNKELEEFEASIDNISAAGASMVLAVREDTALATSDNSAVVIRREEER